MSADRLTNTMDPPRWKLTNYCRKECNAPANEDGGHFERHVGGPWMLAADVLPLLEDLQRELRLAVSARDYANDMCDKARLSATASEKRIETALDTAIRYGQIDGAHHKTWVIDQVVRALLGDKYDATIAESNAGEDGPETYTWDTGIAP